MLIEIQVMNDSVSHIVIDTYARDVHYCVTMRISTIGMANGIQSYKILYTYRYNGTGYTFIVSVNWKRV